MDNPENKELCYSLKVGQQGRNVRAHQEEDLPWA